MTMTMPELQRRIPAEAGMNDQLAMQVANEWKRAFSDASLLPVIGLPNNSKGVMTLTHTMGPNAPPLVINGLPSLSPLANNALYSAEVSRGKWLNLYEIMLPDIPGSNGEPSTTQKYINAMQRQMVDVASSHYHWTGARMVGYFATAIHTQQVGMDPIEFTRRTIAGLSAALGSRMLAAMNPASGGTSHRTAMSGFGRSVG